MFKIYTDPGYAHVQDVDVGTCFVLPAGMLQPQAFPIATPPGLVETIQGVLNRLGSQSRFALDE